MSDPFDYADDLGPAKIIHVHEPTVGLRGILVVDNVATGPSIGGLRMASDVSLAECFRLARAMTMKNAAAGLAHGGGKSVIFADPRTPDEEKERLLRTFASALRQDAAHLARQTHRARWAASRWTRSVQPAGALCMRRKSRPTIAVSI